MDADTISLAELNYTFTTRPLLIGGMAMEFYGLRPSGADIDFVITRPDYDALAKFYPNNRRDLGGDLGVTVGKFELWITICMFNYDELAVGALEYERIRVVSLEKLMLLKALGMHVPKYENDLRLIVRKILDVKYGKATLPVPPHS